MAVGNHYPHRCEILSACRFRVDLNNACARNHKNLLRLYARANDDSNG
jgi:hypothetical protein